MSRWRKLIAVLVMPVLLISMSSTALVSAQQNTGSGLNLSPTRNELTVQPGGKDIIKLTIRNVSGVDIVAKVEVNDFSSDNQTGEPKINVDNTTQNGASIRPFLIGVSDVELKKDEKKDITINVLVPNKSVPGAYYGVIRYTAIPVTEGTQKPGEVALTASVGTLVLLEVPGNINEQIQVKSVKVFTGDKDHKKSGTFFIRTPNQVAITTKNAGNGFSKPFGKVMINDMSGKQVDSYELNNTDPKANILPNTERVFVNDIHNIKWPGRYTVNASLSSGTSGQLVNYSVSFWYMPLWSIVALGGIIFLLILAGVLLYRKIAHPSHRHR
jgi:hypothetical protein